jgi:hypothetical protein
MQLRCGSGNQGKTNVAVGLGTRQMQNKAEDGGEGEAAAVKVR